MDFPANVNGSTMQEFVGASHTDLALLHSCAQQAAELVDAYIGDGEVPCSIRERAIIEVGVELFHRRNAPGGITQFATLEGASPVRMARNPMVAAYPLLDPFLSAGLA